MTRDEKRLVAEVIETEGFCYSFLQYSDFEEVKDPKFHELRTAFKRASEELARYCGVADAS